MKLKNIYSSIVYAHAEGAEHTGRENQDVKLQDLNLCESNTKDLHPTTRPTNDRHAGNKTLNRPYLRQVDTGTDRQTDTHTDSERPGGEWRRRRRHDTEALTFDPR